MDSFKYRLKNSNTGWIVDVLVECIVAKSGEIGIFARFSEELFELFARDCIGSILHNPICDQCAGGIAAKLSEISVCERRDGTVLAVLKFV